MPTRRTPSLLLVFAALSACGPSAPVEAPPLEGASIGAPFTLVGEDGAPVAWDDFAGRYRIVYFGYTFCPDVCSTDMARIAQGWRLFDRENPGHEKDVAGLFVTVDPKRDTPQVVLEFTDAFDRRIVGITGEEAKIDAAARSFGVFAERQAPNAEGGYLVDHTNITYLFDRDGKPLATLPVDQGPEAVAAEIAKWVR